MFRFQRSAHRVIDDLPETISADRRFAHESNRQIDDSSESLPENRFQFMTTLDPLGGLFYHRPMEILERQTNLRVASRPFAQQLIDVKK